MMTAVTINDTNPISIVKSLNMMLSLMPATVQNLVRCARAPAMRPAAKEIIIGACLDPGPSALNTSRVGTATRSTKNTIWMIGKM